MNKRSLILLVSPSIGVLIAAHLLPFISGINALTWDDVTIGIRDSINGLSQLSQAQTPLPVPQNTPPVGKAGVQATIQPCAAPPPTMASVPISEETRPSLEQFHPPRDEDSKPLASPVPTKTGGYKERRTKILMGTASGNLTASLVERVGLADEQIDAVTSRYYTEDGTISLITNELGDRVVSIQLVSYQ